ncbi:MAG: radical SAM family heme chaperone HemW [Chthoniobacter sp.]|nr:radical SAM family heme chaperone HemW [Chthoniobacter sp.]
MSAIRHLYFHIPFCPKLCPYCCFYVETGAQNKTTRFLDALLHEVDRAKETHELRPETIYFGGGTPSALTCEQLEYLLGGLRARLDLSELREWTFEVNPATVRADKAQVLRDAGVSRISLGVQSWDDALLKTLGRIHDAGQAEKTYGILRDAGFDNINIDLMFAVPGQSVDQWQATLDRTIALHPQHVSSYCLTYEEDTEYFRQLKLGTFRQDDDRDVALFETTIDTLTAAGFGHYEISNYARPGFESTHNFAYWQGADYLGFGPSAFSTVGLRRWQIVPDTAGYTERTLANENTVHFTEELTEATRAGEIAAFAMRTRDGIATDALGRWGEEMREFHELGFLEDRNGRTVLTRRGKLMADSVAEAFV